MPSLLVICNGATATHDVSDAINANYGITRNVIKK